MRITEINDAEWDHLLAQSPFESIFQSSFWMNSICSIFGGTKQFVKCETLDNIWLVPFFQGKPWSTGYRIGSVGYGGPLPIGAIDNVQTAHQSMREIAQELQKKYQCPCTGFTTFPWSRWGELAPNSDLLLSQTQIIPLKPSHHDVFNSVITGNVRTAIRRAAQEKITVRKLAFEEVDQAAHLLNETQKSVNASYRTPKEFLNLLHASPNKAQCWGAFHENQLTAMSVLLIHNKRAFHLFHGWKREHLPGTNQSLIWEMVKSSIDCNCQEFNMGESHSLALKEAKKRWGTEMVPILRYASI